MRPAGTQGRGVRGQVRQVPELSLGAESQGEMHLRKNTFLWVVPGIPPPPPVFVFFLGILKDAFPPGGLSGNRRTLRGS